MDECHRSLFPHPLMKGQGIDDDPSLSQDGVEERNFLPHNEDSKIALQNQRAAVEHNNHSVLLLKHGCYLEALQHLTQALQFCRKAMVNAPMQRQVGTPTTNIPTSLDAYLCQDLPFPVKNEDERLYYNRLVPIPYFLDDSSYRACVLLSTLVTFNFSLVNHVLGLLMLAQDRNGNNSASVTTSTTAAHLQMAATSYQLAYSMQHAEGFTQNNLFESAVFNNLGLLHSQLGNYPAADKCWEHLWRLVREHFRTQESQSDVFSTSSDAASPNRATTSALHYRMFWRNVSALFSRSSSAAAA